MSEEHKHNEHKPEHKPGHHETHEQHKPAEHNVHEKSKKTDVEFIAQVIIISILALLLVYNFGKLTNIDNNTGGSGSILPSVSASEIIPKGEPNIYGKELAVKYDDISTNDPRLADKTIGILGDLDVKISLNENDLNRYIKIASQISCEYCCGAKSIIFDNGEAACGCAHSYAMRGLAKYLLTNHGTEFTDDQILEELGKWKVLFFPGIHLTKAAVLKSQGIEINYINLASNKYRGIEQGQQTSGSMVGGC